MTSLFFFLWGMTIASSGPSWNITDDRLFSEGICIIKLSHIINGVMFSKLKSLVSTSSHIVLAQGNTTLKEQRIASISKALIGLTNGVLSNFYFCEVIRSGDLIIRWLLMHINWLLSYWLTIRLDYNLCRSLLRRGCLNGNLKWFLSLMLFMPLILKSGLIPLHLL